MIDYNVFRTAKCITNGDMIRAVRAQYPRYSKAQHSMVNNPDKNGVCLLPEAEALLVRQFGQGPGLSISEEPQKKKHSHDNKAKPRRLCLRLSEPMFEQVNALMAKMCFATMQDLLEAAVQQMVERYAT